MNQRPIITGTQIQYYIVCHRKLWLFSHNITMEHTSEAVELGSLLHQSAYARKKKEISLDGIKIDFFDKNSGVIHEVKKSRRLDEAHHWQVKYYIYHFKIKGLSVRGIIDYPKIRQREEITLSAEDEVKIEGILTGIINITERKTPPEFMRKPYCKKCSYYELCFV